MRDVDPEPVDAPVEPEAEDVLEHVADLGVAPVEVGLGAVEEVEVPLPVRHAGPRVAAEHRLPVVGRLGAVRSAAVAEEVAGPLRAARRRRQRGLEPRVLARGVVGDQVDDHLEPELVGPGQQRVGVRQRAEERVDVAVVGDVVAVVVLRRGVERRDPEGVDAEVAEVGQPRGDAREVADAVAVAVRERAHVDLVGDRLAPPRLVGGRRIGSFKSGIGTAYWVGPRRQLNTAGSTVIQTCSAVATRRPAAS